MINNGDLLTANLFNEIETNITNKKNKIKYLQINTLPSDATSGTVFEYSTSYMQQLLENNSIIILKYHWVDPNSESSSYGYRFFYVLGYQIESTTVKLAEPALSNIRIGSSSNEDFYLLIPDENDSDVLKYYIEESGQPIK